MISFLYLWSLLDVAFMVRNSSCLDHSFFYPITLPYPSTHHFLTWPFLSHVRFIVLLSVDIYVPPPHIAIRSIIYLNNYVSHHLVNVIFPSTMYLNYLYVMLSCLITLVGYPTAHLHQQFLKIYFWFGYNSSFLLSYFVATPTSLLVNPIHIIEQTDYFVITILTCHHIEIDIQNRINQATTVFYRLW